MDNMSSGTYKSLNLMMCPATVTTKRQAQTKVTELSYTALKEEN